MRWVTPCPEQALDWRKKSRGWFRITGLTLRDVWPGATELEVGTDRGVVGFQLEGELPLPARLNASIVLVVNDTQKDASVSVARRVAENAFCVLLGFLEVQFIDEGTS